MADLAIVLPILGFVLSLTTTLIASVFLVRANNNAAVKIQEIHVLVNQQKSDMLSYQVTLIEALRDAGISVPINPHPND